MAQPTYYCKNASGTTVAVPAATSTFIYNTSTNVVDALAIYPH